MEPNAAVYRGELAIRAGLADRVGTLDLAIAEMAAELDRAAMPARSIINPTPKRSTSMANEQRPNRSPMTRRPWRTSAAAPAPAPNPEPAPPPIQAPAPEPTPEPARTRSSRAATRGICRDRRPRRPGHQAWRERRCRGRHATGRLRGRSSPFHPRHARRARRGDKRHRGGPIHACRRRQPDRAARQGTRRCGGSRLIT